jgi:4'-phosphopantetheinyl transferase
LHRNEIHVWKVDLGEEVFSALRAYATLSAQERGRADKFKFDRDRIKYVRAHTALHHILASYLNVQPGAIEFSEGPQGKPDLILPPGKLPLKFNLSHSGDAALVAVTLDRHVGIDIEYVQRELDCLEIADRFFAPAEIRKLRALDPETQTRAFFTCWTRKEAYIKAKGGGLSIPLQDFEVSLAPGEKAALLWHRTDPKETRRWQFEEISVIDGYAATAAVEGRGCTVRSFRWPDDASIE